jgi:hypothetical protein
VWLDKTEGMGYDGKEICIRGKDTSLFKSEQLVPVSDQVKYVLLFVSPVMNHLHVYLQTYLH